MTHSAEKSEWIERKINRDWGDVRKPQWVDHLHNNHQRQQLAEEISRIHSRFKHRVSKSTFNSMKLKVTIIYFVFLQVVYQNHWNIIIAPSRTIYPHADSFQASGIVVFLWCTIHHSMQVMWEQKYVPGNSTVAPLRCDASCKYSCSHTTRYHSPTNIHLIQCTAIIVLLGMIIVLGAHCNTHSLFVWPTRRRVLSPSTGVRARVDGYRSLDVDLCRSVTACAGRSERIGDQSNQQVVPASSVSVGALVLLTGKQH